MIRHVAMWTFADRTARGNRAENLAEAKRRLEELPARIEAIRRLEVGIDELRGPASAHLVLVSDFDDWNGLRAYQEHPAHQEVAELIGEMRVDRWVVDYEHQLPARDEAR